MEVEPHVMMRLKRVFPKVNGNAFKVAVISDTEENARDLVWFVTRYPMEIKNKDYLIERATAYDKRRQVVNGIFTGKHIPRDYKMAFPPRDYQKVAAEALLCSGRLILGDEVGLGKTISAIATFTEKKTLPVLVAVLAHLPRQWKAEINRFMPGLHVHVLRTGQPYDISRKGHFPDVIISSYHKLKGWADILAGKVNSVIFDECQELRRTESRKYSAAKHIASKAQYRMGLSATPIYNYGTEIHAISEVIAPGELGTLPEFQNEWCSAFYEKVRDPVALGAHLRDAGLLLRRTRRDVGRELPAIQHIPYEIDSDIGAIDKIRTPAAELARIILNQNPSARGAVLRASEELNNMVRQATGVAKAPYVADFVRLLVESGEKVVLYGWHREVYSLWAERLADLYPAFYTGTESDAQKNEAKNKFINGDTRVLIISLRSGAGLDGLQKASRTVVFGELDWSPGVHHQCEGRIHRDGQKEPVVSYYLISNEGSDPIVSSVLGLKMEQAMGVVEMKAGVVEGWEQDPGKIRRLAESFLKKSEALF